MSPKINVDEKAVIEDKRPSKPVLNLAGFGGGGPKQQPNEATVAPYGRKIGMEKSFKKKTRKARRQKKIKKFFLNKRNRTFTLFPNYL